MSGATPSDHLICRFHFERMRYDDYFIAPLLKDAVPYPAFEAMVDWQQGTSHLSHLLLIAGRSYIPFTATVMQQAEAMTKGMGLCLIPSLRRSPTGRNMTGLNEATI